jgi:hypothetical protein
MFLKKIIPNLIVIAIVLVGSIFYVRVDHDSFDYWTFVGHHLVLNVGTAGVGVIVGYLVKNYLNLLFGASFVLVIYCLTYSFQSDFVLMWQFFLAIYTVILIFSAFANIARHYKDWLLFANRD